MPHADAATADPLTHGQLQEEQRDPNDDQQHQVGHQVGTWGGGRDVGVGTWGGGRDVGGRLEHGSQVREGWQPGPTASATSPIILKLSQALCSSRNALLTHATYRTLAAQTSFSPLAPLTQNTKGGARWMSTPDIHKAGLTGRHPYLLTHSVDTRSHPLPPTEEQPPLTGPSEAQTLGHRPPQVWGPDADTADWTAPGKQSLEALQGHRV